jgi:hypothetical protein
LIGNDSTYKEINTKKEYKEYMSIITDDISTADWYNYIIIENDSIITFKDKMGEVFSSSYKVENGFLVLTDKQASGLYAFDNDKKQLLCYSLGQFAISKKYEEFSFISVYPPHTYDRALLLNDLIRSSCIFISLSAFNKKMPKPYYLMPNDTLCMVWGKAFYKLE